jgi:poly(3-hydroxybutyrate) depolymerase
MTFQARVACALPVIVGLLLCATGLLAAELPPLVEIQVRSTLDGTEQPSLLWRPESTNGLTPLFVFLHSWSGDYRQANDKWLRQAVERGWIYLHPNFRGINDHPEACGSKLARQDVLDAIDDVRRRHNVDENRVYLAGVSGGGHMAMLMAGHHPERFSAVSAWVGISDLADWHKFHTRDGSSSRYAQMIVACCGGPPGSSPAIDAEYRARSPLFHIHRVGSLPLDLNAGVHDGHTGSVPIHHTLRAFNAVAKAGGYPQITEQEMSQLWKVGALSHPAETDAASDSSYEKPILLRRYAGPARVTIFEGGHESLPGAACAWLAAQRRTAEAGPSK